MAPAHASRMEPGPDQPTWNNPLFAQDSETQRAGQHDVEFCSAARTSKVYKIKSLGDIVRRLGKVRTAATARSVRSLRMRGPQIRPRVRAGSHRGPCVGSQACHRVSWQQKAANAQQLPLLRARAASSSSPCVERACARVSATAGPLRSVESKPTAAPVQVVQQRRSSGAGSTPGRESLTSYRSSDTRDNPLAKTDSQFEASVANGSPASSAHSKQRTPGTTPVKGSRRRARELFWGLEGRGKAAQTQESILAQGHNVRAGTQQAGGGSPPWHADEGGRASGRLQGAGMQDGASSSGSRSLLRLLRLKVHTPPQTPPTPPLAADEALTTAPDLCRPPVSPEPRENQPSPEPQSAPLAMQTAPHLARATSGASSVASSAALPPPSPRARPPPAAPDGRTDVSVPLDARAAPERRDAQAAPVQTDVRVLTVPADARPPLAPAPAHTSLPPATPRPVRQRAAPVARAAVTLPSGGSSRSVDRLSWTRAHASGVWQGQATATFEQLVQEWDSLRSELEANRPSLPASPSAGSAGALRAPRRTHDAISAALDNLPQHDHSSALPASGPPAAGGTPTQPTPPVSGGNRRAGSTSGGGILDSGFRASGIFGSGVAMRRAPADASSQGAGILDSGFRASALLGDSSRVAPATAAAASSGTLDWGADARRALESAGDSAAAPNVVVHAIMAAPSRGDSVASRGSAKATATLAARVATVDRTLQHGSYDSALRRPRAHGRTVGAIDALRAASPAAQAVARGAASAHATVPALPVAARQGSSQSLSSRLVAVDVTRRQQQAASAELHVDGVHSRAISDSQSGYPQGARQLASTCLSILLLCACCDITGRLHFHPLSALPATDGVAACSGHGGLARVAAHAALRGELGREHDRAARVHRHRPHATHQHRVT